MKVNILGLASPARYELSELVSGLKKHQKIWQNFEVETNLFPSCFAQDYYETIAPEAKCTELMEALQTNLPIIALRGGYSTNFMLDYLDWTFLASKKGIIVGHSDLTILLNHLAFRCNWQVWHGPLFTAVSASDNQSIPLLKDCLNGKISELSSFSPIEIINPQNFNGVICGGNLSLITGVIGTKYELDLDAKIVLIEEVNEPDYKIDAMLYQLVNHYDVNQFTAIIFGSMLGCNYEQTPKNLGVKAIIQKYFASYSIPIILNFSSSHVFPMTPLPLNRKIMFDFKQEKFIMN